MENLRILFWIGFPILVWIWYSFAISRRYRLGICVLLVWVVLLIRILYGPLSLLIPMGGCQNSAKPSIHAVVLTEENSNRKDFVKSWFESFTTIPLEVDTHNLAPGKYKEELGDVKACDEKTRHLDILAAFTVRVRRYLLRQEPSTDDDWYLILESDAKPVYPHSFQRNLECLTQYEVDFIWLDYRNVVADLVGAYAGGTGYLIRGTSLSKLAAELKYDEESCHIMDWPVSPDVMWGLASKRKRLKSFTQVMLTEQGFPSSLGYRRDETLGEQSVQWFEYVAVNLFCAMFVVVMLLRVRRK